MRDRTSSLSLSFESEDGFAETSDLSSSPFSPDSPKKSATKPNYVHRPQTKKELFGFKIPGPAHMGNGNNNDETFLESIDFFGIQGGRAQSSSKASQNYLSTFASTLTDFMSLPGSARSNKREDEDEDDSRIEASIQKLHDSSLGKKKLAPASSSRGSTS